MTAVDANEVGRLDRILAEQARRLQAARYVPVEDWPTLMQEFDQRGAEVLRLRSMVAALEAECAALTDALGDPSVTHEFELYSRFPKRCDRVGCALSRDAAVHRTPARVRAELEAKK